MKHIIKKIIASLAISGLVLYWTGPALASSNYDPNDQFFDPSGTYVPPAQVVIPVPAVTPAPDTNSTSDLSLPASPNTNEDSTDQPDGQLTNTSTNVSENSSNSDQNATESNTETGNDSDNESSNNSGNSSDANIDNDASIINNANADAISGDNSADQNTGYGSVESGDSDIAANIVNLANTIIEGASSMAMPIINYFGDLIGNLSLLDDGSNSTALSDNSSLTQIASNSQTGADSNNQSQITNNNDNNSVLNNVGTILNNLLFGANSGNNSANQNTGDGSIETGDANVASNVVNFLNNTITASNLWMGMFNIFGNWAGNLLLPNFAGTNNSIGNSDMNASNSQTGADSDNNSTIQSSNSSDTTITNGANIIDGVKIDANTGQNTSLKNTLDGGIQTGNINVKNNMLSVANNTIVGDSWWMMIINSLSGWTGAIVGAPDGSQTFVPFMYGSSAANTETGADSNNTAEINNDQSTTTEINNTGEINNNIKLLANTGKNTASENTGSGNIKTGDANVMSNLVNFVNNTFNVKNWMFGIVNVFGTWKGNATFGDGNGGNSLPSTQTNLSAENNNTGADSDNDAVIENNNSSELTINNNLKYNSTQRNKANTGENISDKNTGNGNLISGDIGVDSALALYGNVTELADGSGSNDLNANASNSDTGYGSDNNAIIKVIGKLKIVINNVADVYKKVVIDLNTGNNSSEKNTGDGSVISGDINAKFVATEIINVVNIIKATVIKPIPPDGRGGDTPTDSEKTEPILPEILGDILPSAGVGILTPLLIIGSLIGITYWRRKVFKTTAPKTVKRVEK